MQNFSLKLCFIQFGKLEDSDIEWANATVYSSDFESYQGSGRCAYGFSPGKINVSPDNSHIIGLRLKDDLIAARDRGDSYIEIIPQFGMKSKKGVIVPVISDYKLVSDKGGKI